MAQLVGETYEKLRIPESRTLGYSCFRKAGCLITPDGSEDHLKKSAGLDGYVVPPPTT